MQQVLHPGSAVSLQLVSQVSSDSSNVKTSWLDHALSATPFVEGDQTCTAQSLGQPADLKEHQK